MSYCSGGGIGPETRETLIDHNGDLDVEYLAQPELSSHSCLRVHPIPRSSNRIFQLSSRRPSKDAVGVGRLSLLVLPVVSVSSASCRKVLNRLIVNYIRVRLGSQLKRQRQI